MYETVLNGDLFQAPVEALVNPVNCMGVMGAGLALKFKEKFPYNFLLYKKECEEYNLKIGTVFITTNADDYGPKYIINFPTKFHFAHKSKLEYIFSGMADLKKKLVDYDIKSVAIPKIGCGLGGLDWHHVKRIILSYITEDELLTEKRIMLYE